MYINTQRGNTNIDNQFKKKFSFGKNINYKLLLIIGIPLLIIVISAIILLIINNRVKYYIILSGADTVNIYQGDEYIDPGYLGKDSKNNDLTSSIVVDNKVDSSKIGTYEIIYELNGTTKKRVVNVVEKGVGQTTIYLSGDNIVYINIGDTYREPGYRAIDSIDSNITHSVKITNNIDSSKVGTYRVVYTVTNSSGITTSKTRTVIVK